jgi:hypothetical protein
MSHYTSPPPPYQQYAPTQTFRPDYPNSIAQGHTLNGHSHGYGCHRHHGHGHVRQAPIVVPTRPVSRIVIHSRSNETDYLLPRGRHRNDGPGCCFFTIIGAIFILAVFYIVQFVPSMPLEEVTWTNLESHSCTTYATREYVAELTVSPWSSQKTEICMRTPVVVHHRPHWPSKCEYRSGTIIGHFAINHDEPDCVTYWSGYNNWGCTAQGSKKRHIEQHLMNVPVNADYKEFCATTPAYFLNQEFSGADSCLNSIWGVYGQWFIDDPNC